MEPRIATTDQLRQDIDSGRTGDKVAGGDPAAAPLGADEEAAGTPVAAEAVAQARNAERRTMPRAPAAATDWTFAGVVAIGAGAVLALLIAF